MAQEVACLPEAVVYTSSVVGVVQLLDRSGRRSWRLVCRAASAAVVHVTRHLSIPRTPTPLQAIIFKQLPRELLSLDHLSIYPDANLCSLQGLPTRIQRLEINVSRLHDLTPLAACKALRLLKLTGVKRLLPELGAAILQLQGLQELSVLRHEDLPAGAAALLAPALHQLTALTKLSLAGNTPCVSALLPMLHLPQLQHLQVGNCKLGAEGAAAFAPALSELTALQSLELFGNSIGPWGAAALAPAIQHLTLLRRLSFHSNQLGDRGAAALAPAIQQLTELEALDLGQNCLSTASSADLYSALKQLSGLQTLDLGCSGKGCRGHFSSRQQIDLGCDYCRCNKR